MAKNTTAAATGADVGKIASDAANKQLAEFASKELAVRAAPNFEEDAGMGTEGVDKDSQAIPFLAVLQSNSPAVAEGLVKDAKIGQFINTVTNEVFDAVTIVPCAFERRYVEWAPRKLGGGFKGEHMPVKVEAGEVGYQAEGGGYFVPTEAAPKALAREEAKDKHHMLKDTRKHFVMVVRADGTFFPALMPLASTQIKKSKKLMSMVLGVQLRNAAGALYNPASFSHMYRLTTAVESNDQGSWRGVLVEAAGAVQDPELYAAAKEFNKQVMAGKVKVAEPTQDVDAADGGGAGSEQF